MRAEVEVDLESLVSKDLLFIAEDGIGELRVKGGDRLRL